MQSEEPAGRTDTSMTRVPGEVLHRVVEHITDGMTQGLPVRFDNPGIGLRRVP